jgi:hypothetical protein
MTSPVELITLDNTLEIRVDAGDEKENEVQPADGVPGEWKIIACPVAGKKNAKKIVEEELMPKLKEAGIKAEVIYTERAAHATELAKQYGSPSCGLIAVGGDGTIHEVMDGLLSKNMLDKVPLGLLSQGTMNFYAISSDLPSATELAAKIKENKSRQQSLMRVTDNSDLNTRCFEAMYFGVGYEPAKGAQKWRNKRCIPCFCCGGPMFGIMTNLIYANMYPAKTAVKGKMKLVLKEGGVKEIEDTFFSFIVTQRSPYSGTITPDEMWISYITLAGFPGFGRMMAAFTPPMELISGLVNLYECHYSITKFEFEQDASSKGGQIGVCLDGDPIDAGSCITVEHETNAWKIMADTQFPKQIAAEHIKCGPAVPLAKKWLGENPAADGAWVQQPDTKEHTVAVHLQHH